MAEGLLDAGWYVRTDVRKSDTKVHYFEADRTESLCRLAHRVRGAEALPEAVESRCKHCVNMSTNAATRAITVYDSDESLPPYAKPEIQLKELRGGGQCLLVSGGKLTESAIMSLENLLTNPKARLAVVEINGGPGQWRYKLNEVGKLVEIA